MPTTYVNSINSNPIYADRAEHDAAGNTISSTYATKSEVPTIGTLDLTPDSPTPDPTPTPSYATDTCPNCSGTGVYDYGMGEEPCMKCGGTGLVCDACKGEGTVEGDPSTCPECGGSGTIHYYEDEQEMETSCPTCGGSGWVSETYTCDACGGEGHPSV